MYKFYGSIFGAFWPRSGQLTCAQHSCIVATLVGLPAPGFFYLSLRPSFQNQDMWWLQSDVFWRQSFHQIWRMYFLLLACPLGPGVISDCQFSSAFATPCLDIEGEITLAMSLLLSLGAIPDKVTSATFSTRVRIIPLWGVLDDVTPWCTFQECHICCLSKMQVPDSVSLMCSPLVGKMIENLPGHQLCTKSRLMKPTNSLVGKDVTAFGDNSQISFETAKSYYKVCCTNY